MLLLLDIGNTHTHLGLADARGVRRQVNIKTALWHSNEAAAPVRRFIGKARIEGAALCSVVPAVTGTVIAFAKKEFSLTALELTPRTISGVGINYPQPKKIGPDRLANAVALRHHFGAPSVAVAFGTALAFDVVDKHGDYVGGIIAPGLAVMTDYLHDKTALLPRITIRETSSVIGKSTREAMLIGAVHGYRGLVRELILEQRSHGVTVLFSSHIIPDVESLCDRVAIVLNGRLHRVGTLAEMTRRSVQRVTVRCGPAAILERPAAWGEGVTRREAGDETEFVVHDPARLDEVLETLVRQRVPVHSVVPERASLEALFLEAAESDRPGSQSRTA